MLKKVPGRGASEDVIFIAVPVTHKNLVKPIEDLIRTAVQATESERGGHAVDFAEVERRVVEKTASIELAALAGILAALEVDAERVEIGGKWFTRIGRALGTYYTMAGPAEIERWLYREDGVRNGPVVDAISLRAGVIGRGWLPKTAQAMTHLVQQGTPREAVASARQLGRLPYSRASFDRVAHEVGEAWQSHHADIEDALIQELQIPKTARSVSVSLDRTSIPMEEPAKRPVGRPRKGAPKQPITRVHRMGYCATVTLHDEDGNSLHTLRRGCMPQGDAQQVCESMANDVLRLREKRTRLKIVLLADGAPEMWNLLSGAFPEERFGHVDKLIDFWHLIEKLHAAAVAIHGTEAARDAVADWKRILLERPEGAAAVLRSLEFSGCEHKEVGGKQPVHEAITYLRNNADRMDYLGAREQDLPIGSGNVEATCKTLIGIRMKRSGSRWKQRTGEHILQLRALALSDRYEAALDKLFATRRTAVRRAA